MSAFRQGDREAGDALADMFYPELRRLAATRMKGEPEMERRAPSCSHRRAASAHGCFFAGSSSARFAASTARLWASIASSRARRACTLAARSRATQGRQGSCLVFTADAPFVETRLLILNADPVFQDRALAILDEFDGIETRVVRTMSEAVSVLLGENFDGFVVEGDNPIALDQATSARQHFPSLRIVCLSPKSKDAEAASEQQKITQIASDSSESTLRKQLKTFVSSLAQGGTP